MTDGESDNFKFLSRNKAKIHERKNEFPKLFAYYFYMKNLFEVFNKACQIC